MKILSHSLWTSGELQERAERARALLADCTLCPRHCHVNRLGGERGICMTGRRARVASYGAHFGEEQPLVGSHGSGTIFLASCNLRCCFCQNWDISHSTEDAQEVDASDLCKIILELQNHGCHNINFVTPAHVVPQILDALLLAHQFGLFIPVIYNSSGYESTTVLELLDGVIDIYMPDFKFWESATAGKYANAPDYPEIAGKSVQNMHAQVGDLQLDERGIACKGLLVRHLLMPGALEETRQILSFISSQISVETYVNIMDQYRPCGASRKYPELRRTVSPEEYRQALALAHDSGLTRLDERDLASLLKHLGIL